MISCSYYCLFKVIIIRKRKKRKGKKKKNLIIGDTVQMDLFICLMHMRDSSTDAVNEKETETEH